MPDTLTGVPASLPPSALEPQQPVWTALRQLIRAEPSESVLRIRAMLTHLHATPEERIRALHGLIASSPATYRAVAAECGYCPDQYPWLCPDLALTALVFGEEVK